MGTTGVDLAATGSDFGGTEADLGATGVDLSATCSGWAGAGAAVATKGCGVAAVGLAGAGTILVATGCSLASAGFAGAGVALATTDSLFASAGLADILRGTSTGRLTVPFVVAVAGFFAGALPRRPPEWGDFEVRGPLKGTVGFSARGGISWSAVSRGVTGPCSGTSGSLTTVLRASSC